MPSQSSEMVGIVSRHQELLDSYKNSEIAKLRPFLREIRAEVIDKLSDEDLTALSRRKFNKLLALINKNLTSIYNRMGSELAESLDELAISEAAFEAKTFETAVDVDLDLPSPNQLHSAAFNNPMTGRGAAGGILLTPFMNKISNDSRNILIREIRNGYAQGLTTDQIIRRVVGTKTRLFNDGAILHSKRYLELMVRTSVQHLSAQARERTWQANKDIVKGVRWNSTLDSHTSKLCMSLDGQFFKHNEGPRPPAHIGCRSSVIAELSDRYDFLKEGRTRFARKIDADGNEIKSSATSVNANQTYYDWIKNQPTSFQNWRLGPSRAKLLRNGGLTSRRFAELQLGKNFNILTLEQMRKLEPLAFEKAGV